MMGIRDCARRARLGYSWDQNNEGDLTLSNQAPPAATPRLRRTQAERSASTRARLVAAAVDALYRLGYPAEHMAYIYNAADVLLGASMSEGFGIPLIEAQACGCPVVTTNWSALPELTVNGIATEPAGREWTFHRAWWAIPSVPNIVAALETIYGWPTATRQARAQEGRTFIVQRHAWDTVMARGWRPFLARVASERGLDQPAPTDLTAARLRVERALVEAR